jgi:tetratricopeptide (TPR) repeat protein
MRQCLAMFGLYAAVLAGLAGCRPAAERLATNTGRQSQRLDTLFVRLRTAPDANEAEAIEQQIWAVWTHSDRPEVDRLMRQGAEAMANGDYTSAIGIFDRLVALAPNFPEGWNKRATVHYLRGDYAASLQDIARTLALEKRHFGALSGQGTIYLTQGNLRAALRSFEAVLALSPQAQGTRKLVNALRAKLGVAEV